MQIRFQVRKGKFEVVITVIDAIDNCVISGSVPLYRVPRAPGILQHLQAN